MTIYARVQALTLTGVLALPARMQRMLAGRHVVVDGQTLDTETQLMLRLKRVVREPAAESLPIPEGRRALVKQSAIVGGSQPIGRVRDDVVAGVPVRLYEPTGVEGTGPLLAPEAPFPAAYYDCVEA